MMSLYLLNNRQTITQLVKNWYKINNKVKIVFKLEIKSNNLHLKLKTKN
jgi:hypothetical protein